MPRTSPIYQEDGRVYQADTCARVAEAVAEGRIHMQALARGSYPGRRLPNRMLPGLRTVGYWEAPAKQDWGLDWHRNEGVEFTWVERGHLGFAVDGHAYQLQVDDFTLTRPWQLHRVGMPHLARGKLHWLILDVGVRRPHQSWRWPDWVVLAPADLEELTEMLRKNAQPVWRASGDIRRAFMDIGRSVAQDIGGSRASRLAVQINHLLLAVLETLRRQDVVLDHSLSTTLRTVELFWADVAGNADRLAKAWTVRTMARECGLGVTRFTALCRELTHTSPMQYLNQLRLSAAAGMLRDQALASVTEIALRCGFSTSQYFATAFRRQFGRSPREARQAPPRKP